MNVFNSYSKYYNLLYKDKDYSEEVNYVKNLFAYSEIKIKNILDLGCGTGKHDFLLAEKGFNVTGVDLSPEMIKIANIENKKHSLSNSLNFITGDIRSVSLNKKFDTVLSLFHVMSYQTSNDDLQATFKTAREHLKKGGLFIFDCWYGPAVLSDRPVVRIKRLEDKNILVTRIAEPVMHPDENIVDVNYTVLIKDKNSGKVEEIKETHRMRYLFLPEIKLFIEREFELIDSREWLSGKKPDFETWGVCYVLRAI